MELRSSVCVAIWFNPLLRYDWQVWGNGFCYGLDRFNTVNIHGEISFLKLLLTAKSRCIGGFFVAWHPPSPVKLSGNQFSMNQTKKFHAD